MLPVGIRRPGRDEDQLRRAWRAVRLPLLEIADQALAEAAARVPEEEGGTAIAYGVEIDLFALEIVELNVWRLAADLDTARRGGRCGLGLHRGGIEQVGRFVAQQRDDGRPAHR